MHGVAALLLAAAGGHALARLLRAPGIPFLLLAGIGLKLVSPPPPDLLEDALLLGVSFLLFIFGLELDPRRTGAQRGAAIRVGILQFSVLAVLGYATASGLGFAPVEAGYLALALTASSTLVCVRLLQRRRQMFEPFGRLVLGVLLLQDLLVLLSIPLVTELRAGGGDAALATLGGIALLGAVALACRHWLSPLLTRLTSEPELLLLAPLALLFLFLGGAVALDLPIVVGAFLAGTALSRFPTNGIVRSELAPLGDFFAAIFFTALGALVRVPTLTELGHAAIFALLILVITPPLVALVAERAGFSARTGIEAGLLLSQGSELSLVIGLSGMLQGHIGPEVFTVIALVTMGTMLLTPVIATDPVARLLVHLHPGRRLDRGRTGSALPVAEDHVLLLGAGSTGMPLLEDLITLDCKVVVVDDDPMVVKGIQEAGVSAIRGDATDPRVLRTAGAQTARAVVSTIRRPEDNAALLDLARGVPVLVRVFDEADEGWVRRAGGIPVGYAEATAEGFLEWFREEEEALERSWRERTSAVARPT